MDISGDTVEKAAWSPSVKGSSARLRPSALTEEATQPL